MGGNSASSGRITHKLQAGDKLELGEGGTLYYANSQHQTKGGFSKLELMAPLSAQM